MLFPPSFGAAHDAVTESSVWPCGLGASGWAGTVACVVKVPTGLHTDRPMQLAACTDSPAQSQAGSLRCSCQSPYQMGCFWRAGLHACNCYLHGMACGPPAKGFGWPSGAALQCLISQRSGWTGRWACRGGMDVGSPQIRLKGSAASLQPLGKRLAASACSVGHPEAASGWL